MALAADAVNCRASFIVRMRVCDTSTLSVFYPKISIVHQTVSILEPLAGNLC